jgi:predicted NBD/HSP70 family sugar kinase
MSRARSGQPGTPSLMRAINERVLLERLRADGPASRAQLARDCGLSKPTVSQALAHLEEVGLVRIAGRHALPRGRTAVLYEPDPTVAYVVGVDIGRAYIRVAAADMAGTVVARRDVRNRARSAAAVVSAVVDLAHAVASEGGIDWARVNHVVVGSPGVFDPRTGRLRLAPNLPGWSRRGLVDSLREALGPSLAIDNDVNLAAIGELHHGRGAGADPLAFVSVGTGVGMGIIIDGVPFRGANGGAGEIGYLPLAGSPDSADARARGLLETAASADGVVRTAVELGMTGTLTAERVFAAAAEGDERALAAVDREAERLALVVATVAAVVDPELVVLGGGLGGSGPLLIGRIEGHLERLTPLRPRIVESATGHDAVLLGAIVTAVAHAHEQLYERTPAISTPA